MAEEIKKSSGLNLEENVAAAVCYIPLVGVIPAVVFLIIEKSEKVRWNAVQAIVLWLAVVVLDMVLGVSVLAAVRLVPLVNLIGMIVIPLILAIKANAKEQTRLPVLGEVTDRLIKAGK
jgi:uncharacterized membrane protein